MTSFLLLEVLSCCKVWIYQVVVNTKINFVRITTRYIQNLLILNLPGKLTNFEFTGSEYKICIFLQLLRPGINLKSTTWQYSRHLVFKPDKLDGAFQRENLFSHY